jgi:hypothetical protein
MPARGCLGRHEAVELLDSRRVQIALVSQPEAIRRAKGEVEQTIPLSGDTAEKSTHCMNLIQEIIFRFVKTNSKSKRRKFHDTMSA